MKSDSDPLFNLADALSEDIAAAPAAPLAHDAENDPDARVRLVDSFDRIAARATAQSRRRRIVARLRALLQEWPAPVTWTSAMAGVAGIFVVGIVGGMYFHQGYMPTPAAPPQVLQRQSHAKMAERMGAQDAPAAPGPMPYAENRTLESARDAQSNHAAAVQPAPAAAPSAATPPPPPAPAVAAGVADEAKRVRTVDVPPAREAPALMARRAPPDRRQPLVRDQIAALALAEEQKRLMPAPVSQAASSLAPEPPAAAPRAAPKVAPSVANAPARTVTRADAAPVFQWPVRGRVIAAFGAEVGGLPNNGIDVAVPAGTDIRAAEEGVVLYAGDEIAGLGNLILLRHRDDYITAYAHAKSFAVKAGDSVRRGQVIAKSGQTGTANAPQLHFEIRKDTAPVDPAQYLPPG